MENEKDNMNVNKETDKAKAVEAKSNTEDKQQSPQPEQKESAQQQGKPVQAEQSTPVQAKQDKPVQAEQSTPVQAKQDRPVQAEQSTPVQAKQEKPVQKEPPAVNIADEIDKILKEVRNEVKEVQEKTEQEQAVTSEKEEMVDISSNANHINLTAAPDNAAKAVTATKVFSAAVPNTKTTSAKTKEKNPMSMYTVIGIIGAFFLIAASFLGIWKLNPSVTPVSATVNIPDGTVPSFSQEIVFLKGIHIAGVDVSGKTLEEAQALLSLKGEDLISDVSIKIGHNGEEYGYTKEDFDFTYDIPSTLQKAYAFNESVLDKNSADAVGNALTTDSSYDVDAEKGIVNFKLDGKVTESSVQKVVKRVAKEIDIPCVEPHATKFDPSKKGDKRFTFKEGNNGTAINQDQLRLDILDAFERGDFSKTLSVTTQESKPELSMEEVKKATVLLSKFSTVSSNTYNANENMRTALKAMNGTIIEPGGIYSFNKLTGDSNQTSNGYLPAGVIAGGEMTTGIGGGICQAATTIYNAAILANMEVVERSPHLWCSQYVYGGLDAAIDWQQNDDPTAYQGIDLKMKNTTKYQMFMKAYMEGVTLNIEIYGWQDPSFDEIRTESHSNWQGSSQYGFLAERVYYLNGKEVKRANLPDSVYDYSAAGIRPGDPGNVSTKINR